MPQRPRRVLVVDDDATIRAVVGEMLADEGYETRLAAHGQEALAALAARRADLIILDLMMPVMDGWAFRAAQQAHAELAGIPVLVLSAGRDLTTVAARLSPAAIVAKPFDLIALLDEIERVLNAAPPPGRFGQHDGPGPALTEA
jgi:CheY-like chemotaxis protein